MFLDNLASSVLQICDARSISYETAAELCNLSPRYFGSIARAQAAASIVTLEKLCAGFERTPNELLRYSSREQELIFRCPMRVTHVRRTPYLNGQYTTFPVCPQCNCSIEREYQAFCSECGQKLDWDGFHYAKVLTGSCR